MSNLTHKSDLGPWEYSQKSILVNTKKKFSVQCIDAAAYSGDVLVLKFAETYRGADAYISKLLNHNSFLMPGQIEVVNKQKIRNNLAVQNVVYFGVGELINFRYEKLRQFGFDQLMFCSQNVQKLSSSFEPLNVATTVHGPGFGLDEREAIILGVFHVVINFSRTQ